MKCCPKEKSKILAREKQKVTFLLSVTYSAVCCLLQPIFSSEEQRIYVHLKPPWECLQLCLNTWRHRIWSVKPLPMWEGGSRGWGLVLALPGPFGLFVFTGGKPLCESVQKHEHGWPPRAFFCILIQGKEWIYLSSVRNESTFKKRQQIW